MLILAFDTTSLFGGAAVYRGRGCLASTQSRSASDYSVTLFEMSDHLLRSVNLGLRDVELFAVASGPGSFTGTRVGLAAAQAWGRAFERPVCGISILHAMIVEADAAGNTSAALMDARRGELFMQMFGAKLAEGDAALPLAEGLLVNPSAVGPMLEKLAGARPLTCVVRESDAAARACVDALPSTFDKRIVSDFLVGAIARIGLDASGRGGLPSPSELDAYYIRRSDAELKWTE